MATLVKMGNYGPINKTDTTKVFYYGIKLLSEAQTLQEYTTFDKKISTNGELVVRAQ